MGKNQAYKAMQRAKMSTQSAPGGVEDVEDGMMDGSFHSPEWHAARLASLQTSHTITWEEYRKRQKEEAKKKEEQEDDEVRLMKDYRAQLDAERARKLARGSNHTSKRPSSKGRKDKEKNKRKKLDRKRKHTSGSESDCGSASDEGGPRSGKRDRERVKREKRERRRKASGKKSSRSTVSGDSSSSDDTEYGPVPLSSYFDGCAS